MKKMFKGVDVSGVKKRERSQDDSRYSDLEKIKDSLEKLKMHTLTTYNILK